MQSGTPSLSACRRLVLWAGTVLVLLGGLATYAWKGQKPVAPAAFTVTDPRLTYPTPYRNVRPEVRYVGDAACADCHKEESDSYRHHPMGQSFAPVSAADLNQAAGGPPFEKFGSTFSVERRGDQLYHTEVRRDDAGRPTVELAVPVRYVLGSGSRGKSYLVDLDGYLFQSPIGWFTQKNGWDIAPGFSATTHLTRAIDARCLFCHCNDAAQVKHTLNHYQAPIFRQHAIGCERCHGPGELHVRQRADGVAVDNVDYTIVNPKHLEPALREAVCQQCHLQGESRIVHRGLGVFDFRPGLPLGLFWSVFVRPPALTDNYKAVSQVEQLAFSRCFQKSGGELGCASCHDPHRQPEPAAKVAYYRDRCLKCHEKQACTSPLAQRQAKGNDCAACHMPRIASADIAHAALSDHRILRRQDHVETSLGAPWGTGLPVVSFFEPGAAAPRNEMARDLGLGLVLTAITRSRAGDSRLDLAAAARPLLEEALRTWPEDVAAWEAKGSALHLSGLWQEALAAFDEALARAPNRETALSGAALAAEELRRSDAAIGYWQRLLAVDPHSATAHARLATLLGARERWPEALREGQEVLRLNPFAVEARVFVAQCHLRLGNADKAREEFARVEALKPADLLELRGWFERELRGPR